MTNYLGSVTGRQLLATTVVAAATLYALTFAVPKLGQLKGELFNQLDVFGSSDTTLHYVVVMGFALLYGFYFGGVKLQTPRLHATVDIILAAAVAWQAFHEKLSQNRDVNEIVVMVAAVSMSKSFAEIIKHTPRLQPEPVRLPSS